MTKLSGGTRAGNSRNPKGFGASLRSNSGLTRDFLAAKTTEDKLDIMERMSYAERSNILMEYNTDPNVDLSYEFESRMARRSREQQMQRGFEAAGIVGAIMNTGNFGFITQRFREAAANANKELESSISVYGHNVPDGSVSTARRNEIKAEVLQSVRSMRSLSELNTRISEERTRTRMAKDDFNSSKGMRASNYNPLQIGGSSISFVRETQQRTRMEYGEQALREGMYQNAYDYLKKVKTYRG